MTVSMLLQVISQTAIQEFKQGSAERGRSMFESCLRNYPTRLDVWSQYLDQASLCEPLLRSMNLQFLHLPRRADSLSTHEVTVMKWTAHAQ